MSCTNQSELYNVIDSHLYEQALAYLLRIFLRKHGRRELLKMRIAARVCVLVIGIIVYILVYISFIRSEDPEVLRRLKRIEDQVNEIGEFVLITSILRTLLKTERFHYPVELFQYTSNFSHRNQKSKSR